MMVCRAARVLPVEIVVRGYLSGSGWKEYCRHRRVCGVQLPAGLRESDRLPEPILTPATKAEMGSHDINIDFESMVQLLADWPPNGDDWLGDDVARAIAERARDVALRLYAFGAARCAEAGIVLADTKFEMGLVDGELILVDEALTPDSSRFWDAAEYAPGGPQASFDKQFVRDWLERQPWDKTAPGPALPEDVVAGTRARYVEAFERITGAGFERYLAEDVIAPGEGR
jgi:phosphoribosylaminoimidazole-succinocarboxamide synthase